MLREEAAVRCGWRWGIFGLAAVVAAGAFSDSADARSRRHRHRAPAVAVQSYSPAYASIVVDANSGRVLESDSADSPRHPASLTKIMTLYLLFERIEAGKIKLNTQLDVSAHASVQAPSKLNLKPGDTITVENAIRAIVTKSANDVAVVVAEALGGSESEFARMMTRKAQALGMNHTIYRNASGLPDNEQVTTARDMATLGRAIQDRFPKYYRYFSTRMFVFRGKPMRNHNKLLGAVAGLDGIKTGYTNASGFNLVTSVRRDGRHIVAAVFGGRTASWRDARMRWLIEQYMAKAATRRTEPMVAEARQDAKEQNAKVKDIAGREPIVSGGATLRTVSAEANTAAGATTPIKPNAVKTFTVKAASMPALAPFQDHRRIVPPASQQTASVTTVATVRTEAPLATKAEIQPPPPPGAKPGVLGVLPAKLASAGDSVPLREAPIAAAASMKQHGGWIIQVGAFDDEAEAKQRLSAAQNHARTILGGADPFTEKVVKGARTLFRARFAGLEKEQAEAACKNLRHGEIPCMLLKN